MKCLHPHCVDGVIPGAEYVDRDGMVDQRDEPCPVCGLEDSDVFKIYDSEQSSGTTGS